MMHFASSIPATRILIFLGWVLTNFMAPIQVHADSASDYERTVYVQNHDAAHSAAERAAHRGVHVHVEGDEEAESVVYGNCPVGETNDTVEALQAVNGLCLTPERTADRRVHDRDLQICNCLVNSTGAESTAMNFLARDNPELDQNRLTQRAMNRNVDRLNHVLEAEQNAMQFQASTLPANARTNQFLISAYTSRFNLVSGRMSEVQAAAQRSYDGNSNTGPGSIPMTALRNPETPDGDLYSPPRDSNSYEFCVPLRTYMTAKQFPTDPMFYDNIAQMPAQFRQADWDYNAMKINFIRMSLNVTNLSQALENPEAKKIYLRLKFLERNPLYRNLFSSTLPNSDTQKQALWTMIRNSYGSNTPANSRARFAAFDDLRSRTGEFFTSSPEIIDMVQDGANQNLNRLIQEVPRRVHRISEPYDPSTLWTTASFPYVFGGGRSIMSAQRGSFDSHRSNVAIYARYCPALQFGARQNQYTVLQELEKEFGEDYRTNAYESGSEFYRFSSQLCGERRTGPGGEKSWAQYLYDTCNRNTTGNCAQENHPRLLSQFLNLYPNGTPPITQLEFLLPILEGRIIVPNPDRETSQRATREGMNADFTRSQGALDNLRAANADFRTSSSRSQASVDNAIAGTAPLTPEAIQSTQSQQNNNSPQQQTPVISSTLPSTAIPEASSVNGLRNNPQVPEAVRAELSRNDSEIQSLRDQIAALRTELQSETSKPASQRDEQEIRELTRRFELLNSRLEQVTAEGNRRRRQTAEKNVDEDDTEEVVRKPRRRSQTSKAAAAEASDSSSDEDSSAEQDVVSQLPADRGSSGASRSGGAGSVSGGGASLGRSSSAARSTSGQASAPSGYRRGASQGAITVSEANSSEFQVLREQTNGSEVSEAIPGDEYERIAEGDTSYFTERFSDRLPTRTGDKRRFEITRQGSDTKVEIIVEKTENGISITFGQNGASESDTPAEAALPDRENTLDGLNERLRNSR